MSSGFVCAPPSSCGCSNLPAASSSTLPAGGPAGWRPPGRRARDHRPLPQPALPSNTGEETGITRIWRARRVTRKGTPTVANLTDAFTHPNEYRARVEAEIAAKKAAAAAVKLGEFTRSWTQPLVMRTYETNVKGEALFVDEAAAFVEHGYEASMMSEEGGHIHAGRLLLTGGLSIVAGKKGIRAGGKHTITWKKLGR
jgi:hypothetical protein